MILQSIDPDVHEDQMYKFQIFDLDTNEREFECGIQNKPLIGRMLSV